MNGVLRICSMEPAAIADNQRGPLARTQPQAMPSETPTTAETALSASVKPAPRSKAGHCSSTAKIELDHARASGPR